MKGIDHWYRVLSLGSILCVLLLAIPFTNACGGATHNEICYRALTRFAQDPRYQKYSSLLQSNQDALQAGAVFPDWGYWSGHGPGSEFAHWAYFSRGIAQYLHSNLTQPWSNADEKLVAFLMGAACHAVADIPWHGLAGTSAHAFIPTFGNQNYRTVDWPGPCAFDPTGCYNRAHSKADEGGDLALSYEYGLPWLKEWYIPTDDLASLYQSWPTEYPDLFKGDMDISKWDLEKGMAGLYAEVLVMKGIAPGINAGRLLFDKYDGTFLVEHLNDHFSGGLDDLSVWVTWMWPTLIGYIESGPPINVTTSRAFQRSDNEEDAIPLRVNGKMRGSFHQRHRKSNGVEVPSFRKDRLWFNPDLASDLTVTPHLRGIQLGQHPPHTDPLPSAAAAAAASRSSTRQPSPQVGVPGTHPEVVASLTGENPFDQYGTSMLVGDMNDDGVDDLIVGAPCYGHGSDSLLGRVYVYYGGHSTEVLQLESLATYSRFGQALAIVDWNGDGRNDLVVSAPWTGTQGVKKGSDYIPEQGIHPQIFNTYDGQRTGAVHIFVQGSDGKLPSMPTATIYGVQSNDMIGYTLQSGDMNNDGYDDLFIGSPYVSTTSTWESGLLSLFLSGKHGSNSNISVTDADWSMSGEVAGEWCGYSSTLISQDAGRTIGVAVGCPSYGAPIGKNVTDAVGRVLGYTVVVSTSGGAVQLLRNFTLTGSQAWAQTGHTLASGSPYGDGLQYLLVSSPTTNSTQGILAGDISIIALASLYSRNSTIESVTRSGILEGRSARARLGYRMGVSDLNQDGIDDLWASEPWENSGLLHWTRETGAVYAWYGGKGFPRGQVQDAGSRAQVSLRSDTLQARLGLTVAVAPRNATLFAASHQTDLPNRLAGRVDVFSIPSNIVSEAKGKY